MLGALALFGSRYQGPCFPFIKEQELSLAAVLNPFPKLMSVEKTVTFS